MGSSVSSCGCFLVGRDDYGIPLISFCAVHRESTASKIAISKILLAPDDGESGETYDVSQESARLQARDLGRQVPVSPEVLLNRRDMRTILTVRATEGRMTLIAPIPTDRKGSKREGR